MTKNFLKRLLLLATLVATPASAFAAVTGSVYPALVLKNQFGETSINSITGGSEQLFCRFVVDPTNVNGLGISSLTGTPCASVYMHTTATPATGNPNPANGYIVVNLASQFFKYLGGFAQFTGMGGGSVFNVSSATLTAGNPYIIQQVGTTSTAGWDSLGLPLGLTPTAFQSFIMTGTTTVAGTGQVQAPSTSGAGITLIDLIQDPNLALNGTSALSGGQLILRTLMPTSSSVTTLTATAPTALSVIRINFALTPLSGQLH